MSEPGGRRPGDGDRGAGRARPQRRDGARDGRRRFDDRGSNQHDQRDAHGRRDVRGRRDANGRTPAGGRRGFGDRQERRHPPRRDEPALPEDVTADELGPELRRALRPLPSDLADRVARRLAMVERLLPTDPQGAFEHALVARRIASRVGEVREVCGLAAYRAGRWAETLSELNAARRLTGGTSFLPVIADAERGMGRPERALQLAKSPEADGLDQQARVELRIVESGARRDRGEYDAAVVTLEIPELRDRRWHEWTAGLFYAYADALLDAGRWDEARLWFARAAETDREGETDAQQRYSRLEGLEIVDLEDDDDLAEVIDMEEDSG